MNNNGFPHNTQQQPNYIQQPPMDPEFKLLLTNLNATLRGLVKSQKEIATVASMDDTIKRYKNQYGDNGYAIKTLTQRAYEKKLASNTGSDNLALQQMAMSMQQMKQQISLQSQMQQQALMLSSEKNITPGNQNAFMQQGLQIDSQINPLRKMFIQGNALGQDRFLKEYNLDETNPYSYVKERLMVDSLSHDLVSGALTPEKTQEFYKKMLKDQQSYSQASSHYMVSKMVGADPNMISKDTMQNYYQPGMQSLATTLNTNLKGVADIFKTLKGLKAVSADVSKGTAEDIVNALAQTKDTLSTMASLTHSNDVRALIASTKQAASFGYGNYNVGLQNIVRSSDPEHSMTMRERWGLMPMLAQSPYMQRYGRNRVGIESSLLDYNLKQDFIKHGDAYDASFRELGGTQGITAGLMGFVGQNVGAQSFLASVMGKGDTFSGADKLMNSFSSSNNIVDTYSKYLTGQFKAKEKYSGGAGLYFLLHSKLTAIRKQFPNMSEDEALLVLSNGNMSQYKVLKEYAKVDKAKQSDALDFFSDLDPLNSDAISKALVNKNTKDIGSLANKEFVDSSQYYSESGSSVVQFLAGISRGIGNEVDSTLHGAKKLRDSATDNFGNIKADAYLGAKLAAATINVLGVGNIDIDAIGKKTKTTADLAESVSSTLEGAYKKGSAYEVNHSQDDLVGSFKRYETLKAKKVLGEIGLYPSQKILADLPMAIRGLLSYADTDGRNKLLEIIGSFSAETSSIEYYNKIREYLIRDALGEASSDGSVTTAVASLINKAISKFSPRQLVDFLSALAAEGQKSNPLMIALKALQGSNADKQKLAILKKEELSKKPGLLESANIMALSKATTGDANSLLKVDSAANSMRENADKAGYIVGAGVAVVGTAAVALAPLTFGGSLVVGAAISAAALATKPVVTGGMNLMASAEENLSQYFGDTTVVEDLDKFFREKTTDHLTSASSKEIQVVFRTLATLVNWEGGLDSTVKARIYKVMADIANEATQILAGSFAAAQPNQRIGDIIITKNVLQTSAELLANRYRRALYQGEDEQDKKQTYNAMLVSLSLLTTKGGSIRKILTSNLAKKPRKFYKWKGTQAALHFKTFMQKALARLKNTMRVVVNADMENKTDNKAIYNLAENIENSNSVDQVIAMGSLLSKSSKSADKTAILAKLNRAQAIEITKIKNKILMDVASTKIKDKDTAERYEKDSDLLKDAFNKIARNKVSELTEEEMSVLQRSSTEATNDSDSEYSMIYKELLGEAKAPGIIAQLQNLDPTKYKAGLEKIKGALALGIRDNIDNTIAAEEQKNLAVQQNASMFVGLIKNLHSQLQTDEELKRSMEAIGEALG